MPSEDGDVVELRPLVHRKPSFDESGFDGSPRDSLDIEVPLLEEPSTPQRTERWTKLFVLALACTFSVGSHYSQNSIGPLKDILKQDLSITDTQMSLVLGSNLIANTIVPIVAGVLVAKFGTLKSSLFATSILFLGQAINLLAVIYRNVPGMIFGLCLFGCASTLRLCLIVGLE